MSSDSHSCHLLQIVKTAGSPEERHYAAKIWPVRKNGNLLLCTLLLGNVAVNALLTVLLAELTSGMCCSNSLPHQALLPTTLLEVIWGTLLVWCWIDRWGIGEGMHVSVTSPEES